MGGGRVGEWDGGRGEGRGEGRTQCTFDQNFSSARIAFLANIIFKRLLFLLAAVWCVLLTKYYSFYQIKKYERI
jgi:hypothetical protein